MFSIELADRFRQGGKTVFFYEILERSEDGVDILGTLEVSKISPTILEIGNVEGNLGISGVRRLRQLILKEFPNVTEVVGRRITGVRARNEPGQEFENPLEAPEVRARIR